MASDLPLPTTALSQPACPIRRGKAESEHCSTTHYREQPPSLRCLPRKGEAGREEGAAPSHRLLAFPELKGRHRPQSPRPARSSSSPSAAEPLAAEGGDRIRAGRSGHGPAHLGCPQALQPHALCARGGSALRPPVRGACALRPPACAGAEQAWWLSVPAWVTAPPALRLSGARSLSLCSAHSSFRRALQAV